jgi:hypothetical protein
MRNIIPSPKIKTLFQKADRYWQFIHGLRRAINNRDLKKTNNFLKSIDKNPTPLTPDCSLKLAIHLIQLAHIKQENQLSALGLKMLRKAIMSDPKNKSLDQEMGSLPLSEIERTLISGTRQRMLSVFDESFPLPACTGRF